MKKIINALKSHGAQVFLLVCLISFSADRCVFIDEFHIEQYDLNGDELYYAQANTEAIFTLKGHIQCRTTDNNGVTTNFVMAFLAPKSWKMADNAKVTYKCDLASDHDELMNMSVMPAASLPKNGQGRTWVECLTQEYGVGTNVLDDLEWVVFQTDEAWNIYNNNDPLYTIYIRVNVGEKNLRFHPGIFVNHTDDGFSNGEDHKMVMFSPECFEVVGGTGLVLDYCNNHFNKISPMSSLQDDYLTFTFTGSAAENSLTATHEVYLQGTAYTANGGRYIVNTRDAKSRMVRENDYSDTYNITFWPMDFFEVPEGEIIEHIEYYFSNADGTITITQSDDDFAQEGIPMPDVKEPFTFHFDCE